MGDRDCAAGLVVVVSPLLRVAVTAEPQRAVVVGAKPRREVNQGAGRRLEGVVARVGKRRDREQRPVGVLRQGVGLRAVVVQNVALRRLVADGAEAYLALDLVGHVAPAHGPRRVHQKHDVRLDLRCVRARDRRRRDVGRGRKHGRRDHRRQDERPHHRVAGRLLQPGACAGRVAHVVLVLFPGLLSPCTTASPGCSSPYCAGPARGSRRGTERTSAAAGTTSGSCRRYHFCRCLR